MTAHPIQVRAFIGQRSVPVVVARRENRHAIRVGDADRDRRARRRELAKPVVREHRKVRLAGAVIDNAEDARIRIDVGRCSCRNLRGDQTVDKDVVARSDQRG